MRSPFNGKPARDLSLAVDERFALGYLEQCRFVLLNAEEIIGVQVVN
jgi:hypothetical protein